MKQRNISKGIYSLYVIMFMLMIPIGDLWAQDPLNISGKVVDVNNEPPDWSYRSGKREANRDHY